jgi:hypothetical protein
VSVVGEIRSRVCPSHAILGFKKVVDAEKDGDANSPSQRTNLGEFGLLSSSREVTAVLRLLIDANLVC